MSAGDFARLAKELHDRLDDWASSSDDMCLRAEQQIAGWRAAVENADSPARLAEISALIP